MKKIICISFLILFFMIADSCKKALRDVNGYFPKIKTTVQLLPSGRVKVIGTIESEGAASLEEFGVCCSTQPDPSIIDRQIMISEKNGSEFSAEYAYLSSDSTYYFNAWATNSYGYSTGQAIKIDTIFAVPITAPCSLITNRIEIASGNPSENVNNVDSCTNSGTGYWELVAHGFFTNLYFEFGGAPYTGIYTTSSWTPSAQGQVRVYFYSGSITATIDAGQNVYVNEIAPGHFEITLCNASWVFNSSTAYLNAKVVSPSP